MNEKEPGIATPSKPITGGLTPNKGVPMEKLPPAMQGDMNTSTKTVHKPHPQVTETHVGGAPYKRG